MDCRNFKDLLDSYLCEELAVETNHRMLSHAEHCPPCRSEMASRRNLRESLRRACSKDRMSEAACERLRLRLQSEAASDSFQNAVGSSGWRKRLANFFNFRFLIPATALALLVFGAVGFLIYLKNQGTQVNVAGLTNPASDFPQLSDALMIQAADDHRKCSPHFIPSVGPMEMPESVKEVDKAYFGLEKIAALGAKDLQLHSAHLCRSGGRRFAHLVYTRDKTTISLLVTGRDELALEAEANSRIDADHAEMQEAIKKEFSLGAYQSARHVVVVVSDLPKTENEKLARTLALPVVEYLRRFDNQSAFYLPENHIQDLFASKRGGRF